MMHAEKNSNEAVVNLDRYNMDLISTSAVSSIVSTVSKDLMNSLW